VLSEHVTSDHTQSHSPHIGKMSCNVSENVELGQLTTELKETHEETNPGDDCDEEGDKEGREEEMSLLGVEDSPACPPVQIVISGRQSSGQALIIPNPGHHLHVGPPSSSPCTDPDIQLARTDPDSTRDRVWAVTMPSRQQSSLQSVCGPNPAKLTTICMVLFSIWAMVVLIVHLEKKVSAVSSSLSSMEEKVRSMEDTASSYRLRTQERIQNIQHRLAVILQTVNTGVRPEMVKKTEKPKSVQTDVSTGPSGLQPDDTTQSTEPNITKDTEGDDFFSSDWSLW